MDKSDLQFVKRREFEIPGYSDQLHYAKSTVVLSKDELKQMQDLVLQHDKETIQMFRNGEFDGETPEDQKKIFKKLITKGRETARKELIDRIQWLVLVWLIRQI